MKTWEADMWKRRKELGKKRKGFSLVEVSLAVVMVGGCVLVLLSLFPAGLKQSENALMDTHVGLFADGVFSGIRANAFKIKKWGDWSDVTRFKALAVNNVTIPGGGGLCIKADGGVHAVEDLVAPGLGLAYKMEVGEVSGRTDLRYASLNVCMGKKEEYDEQKAVWFYTEFFYSSMP